MRWTTLGRRRRRMKTALLDAEGACNSRSKGMRVIRPYSFSDMTCSKMSCFPGDRLIIRVKRPAVMCAVPARNPIEDLEAVSHVLNVALCFRSAVS